VTPEDISLYKDFLLGEYQPAAGKNQGIKGLDATTVDNYVGVLNGLYKWARANGSFPRDMLAPTTDQRIMSKKDKKARAQSGKINRAYKPEELTTAFAAAKYRQENRLSHHFWPPLIALFTGMRLGEISQLACTDIFMEEGQWAISINDEDYKRVKSSASRRTIPMHPELVAIGLPQFAQDVKALGLGPQLFPVIRPNSLGEMGNAASKKWDRYLVAAGLTDDALTFHSFRRTANTLLKRKKVPFDVRCQMVGHDLDHVNELYATDFTVADLASIVFPKFVFEGLDLTSLRYQPDEFNQAIKDGLAAALDDEARRAREKERDAEREKARGA
jgi:integrase